MTQICSPLLYLNMGGEMMYVLQKRLHTQKINPDKINQGELAVFDFFECYSDIIYLFIHSIIYYFYL